MDLHGENRHVVMQRLPVCGRDRVDETRQSRATERLSKQSLESRDEPLETEPLVGMGSATATAYLRAWREGQRTDERATHRIASPVSGVSASGRLSRRFTAKDRSRSL